MKTHAVEVKAAAAALNQTAPFEQRTCTHRGNVRVKKTNHDFAPKPLHTDNLTKTNIKKKSPIKEKPSASRCLGTVMHICD